ncbi:MAG: RnfABCDGE type electron transport complex subunit G [Kiritimatiellae bacterium]|nr:RnfABCDGE type electron transport complex subunit G [Kiritimatiellia bacterium]
MKKFLSLVVSLSVISGVCAAVLAYVDTFTKDRIAATKLENKLKAARAVMPGGVAEVVPVAWADKEKKDPVDFAGKGADGKTLGYAVTAGDSGGYGGDIELMVGFKADRKTVVCYKTLAATETPGLGMKLKTPEFSRQFAGRDGSSLKVRQDGGEIEAITSATITSRAVCRAVEAAQKKLQALK